MSDEDRFATAKLDVVGAAVLEPHVVIQRDELNLQGCQCSVLELAEAPLVGIRNKRDDVGPDDLETPVRFATWRFIRVGDQELSINQLPHKTGLL